MAIQLGREMRALHQAATKFSHLLNSYTVTIFTNEKLLDWALDPFNVTDKSGRLALDLQNF